MQSISDINDTKNSNYLIFLCVQTLCNQKIAIKKNYWKTFLLSNKILRTGLPHTKINANKGKKTNQIFYACFSIHKIFLPCKKNLGTEKITFRKSS